MCASLAPSPNFCGKNIEALCSSCTVKPRKFQVRQEIMMASMRKRGRYPCLPYKVFLGPHSEDMDIQFHASVCFINIRFSVGLGEMNEDMQDISSRSIFGDYGQKENRVTAAFLHVIKQGGEDLINHLLDAKKKELPDSAIHVDTQPKGKGSRPDGLVSCDFRFRYYFESKTYREFWKIPHDVQQLNEHRNLEAHDNACLVYITPDDVKPAILNDDELWYNWTEVCNLLHNYETENKDPLLQYLIGQFVLLIENLKLYDTSATRVIIVGGRWGEPVAKTYGFYACQPNRFFLPARYMAFYYNHRIKYLFEIKGTPVEAVDIQKHSAVPANYFIEKESTYKPEMRKLFQLNLIQEFNPEIQNDSKDKNGNLCAFVQRQKYTTLDNILAARYTSQL